MQIRHEVCTGGPNQRWYVKQPDEMYIDGVLLRSKDPALENKCLIAVSGGPGTAHGSLEMGPCTPAPHTKWYVPNLGKAFGA